MKRFLAYDLANLLGIAAITAGCWQKWGWDMAAIVGGAAIIGVNLFNLARLVR